MKEIRSILPPEVNKIGGQLLNQFYALMRLASLHDISNQVFEEPLRDFQVFQDQIIQMEGKAEFRFTEREVFLNLTRLRLTPEIKSFVFSLLNDLKGYEIGGFVFLGALSPAVAKTFLTILGQYFKKGDKNFNYLNNELNLKGISEISFFPYQEYHVENAPEKFTQDLKYSYLVKTYARLLYFTDLLTLLKPGANSPLFVDTLRRLQRNFQKLIEFIPDHLRNILYLHHYKDLANPRPSHAVNVAILSLCLGHFLGLRKTELADLALCGLFHKRAHWFSEPQLLQAGNAPFLNAVAMATDSGVNLSSYRRLLTSFHWKLSADGRSGEPRLKHPETPDLYSKIVAIAANYELMVTPKEHGIGGFGLTPYNALRLLFAKNPYGLDLPLLKLFVNLIGVYPPGCLVLLNTQELAVVEHQPRESKYFYSPRVRIIRDAHGRPVDGGVIDLKEDQRTIEKTIPADAMNINVLHYRFSQSSTAPVN